MMVTMKRNKKSFYVRRVDEVNGIVAYYEPEIVRLNLFPTNSDSDLMALGKEYIEYMRAKISVNESKKYSIGDLIYVDKPKYKDMLDVGNAMYSVSAVLPMLNVAEIQCRRLSGAK